jgi:outer membrane lipase/esterase
LFSTLSTAGAAGPAGFNQFIGFGDSTLDTGFFRYNGTGIPSNDLLIQTAVANGAQGGFAGNGVMGATILGDKFGVSAAPYGLPGGTNYANGDSFTNAPGPYTTSLSTLQQIQTYLTSVNNVANPRALYEISSGNNDVLQYQNYPPDFLSNSALALASAVASLQAAGARIILVPNSFLYAVYAGAGGNIVDPTNAADYERAAQYNLLRWADLTAAGVRFIPADLDSLFKYVVHNPTSFGFTQNTVLANQAPVYNMPSPYNSALLADNLDITQVQQQTYLFIDGKHLTTAGQTIEADYEYSLLAAPSQMSLLAENVVQGGWARAATIQGQLDPCGQQRGPAGINAWVSGGAYSLQVNGAPGLASESGTPLGSTVGLQYTRPEGLIVGLAFSSACQMPGFSTGGHFVEGDEAPSLYVAYVGGPLWGSAIATYDAFQDTIVRPVPLGIFTDQNVGTTSGQSMAIALRGGRDFGLGPILTGPVGGLVAQQVQVNGFTETGTTGVTALSFATQSRDSLVTQLGWRACFDLGAWHPFVEGDWNHECCDKSRSVTASLTSCGPWSYSMDAVPVVSDWCTASLGTYYRFSPQVTLRGAASAMFINPQMTTCGGELSLNVGF